MLALGPAHEQRCVHMISEGTSTRSEANSYLCKWSIKKYGDHLVGNKWKVQEQSMPNNPSMWG
jgi:hypothetical protein